MKVKVNLWNLIENHQPLDILEPSDDGEFKIVNTFQLDKVNNVQNLQEKIFVHLSKLLIKDWSQAKICRFCFNKTISKQEIENFVLLECSTCMRIYEYDSSIDTIPLPISKYQFLWNNNSKCLTHSIDDINIELPIKKGKFSYENLKKNITLDKSEKLDILVLKPAFRSLENNLVENEEVNLFLYQDFHYLIPEETNYKTIFWPNLSQFKEFINDNNKFKELEKQLTTEDDIIENFEKIKSNIVLEKEISKIIIQHNQESTDEELFLLELFHLFSLSTKIPYLSLYISEIDERKHKVYRPFQNSVELQQWLQYRKKGKSLVLKLRFKEHYLTILLSPFNGMKIILPFTRADKTNKTIIKEIIDDIHTHLDRHNISLPPKTVDALDFQTIYLDLFKLEMPESLDIKTLGSLAKCLSPYLIVDQDENSLNMFYIMGVDNKEMVRMDKFLWKYIKQNGRGREFGAYQDELKISLGDEFDLEGEQLDFIFRNWLRENSELISSNPKFFRPIKNGIFIQMIPGEVFRINIRGIQKWQQIDEIVLFLEKFLTLVLNPSNFFKNQCKGIKIIKSLKPKQPKFSKILKTNFPKLFIDNYTTHCQNERQPMVFKDKLKYENWLKEQIVLKDDIFKINDKEYDARVFSRNCVGLPEEKLKQYQEEFNTTNCIAIQQKIFKLKKPTEQVRENNWSKKEIEIILLNLGLNTEGHYEDNIKQINRYFSIQKKLVRENLEDLNPYPNTMIIKQNQQNFYLTCPNSSTKAKEQKQIFMGFLQLDKHPNTATAIGDDKRQWCIPCCTKKVQGKVKEKLNDFCFGLIDYDEYTSQDVGQTSDYILNANKFPLPFGRFGKLDTRLHNLFKSNKVADNVNDTLSEGKTFLRLGIRQSNHSFVSAIITAINFENKEDKRNIQDVYEELQNKLSPKLYSSLNSGNLLEPLETFKTKLDIKNDQDILFQEIWELLSLPNVLTKSGVNIIVFEKVDNEIYIVCPENQEIDHFFDSKKPSILLYKEQSFEFEPIVFIEKQKTNGLVDIETKSIKNWYLNSCRLQDFPHEWTAKSMVTQNTKYQVVDSFNKVMYLVEDKIALPVIPSGIIRDLPIKKEYELLTYEETLKQLPKKYKPSNIILNEDDQVFGIVVQYDLIVPIQPQDYDKKKMLPIRKDLDIYDKVNEAILRDIREYDYSSVKKLHLMKELYERIRYEFSNSNKTIEEFFNENVVIEDISKEELQNYIVPNIRTFCKDINDIHCKNNKIRLPSEKHFKKFKTKLENEMKHNRQKRREILEKDISPIIDLFRFVDSKNIRFY